MKQCKTCLELKENSDFYTVKYKDKIYLYNECKECKLEKSKKNYAKDNTRQREIRRKNTNSRRVEKRQKILEYLLEHPCVDCGEANPIVLEFDHIEEKNFQISDGLMKSWDVLLEEINKCEVVCANCHKKRTARRAGNWHKDILISNQ